jgi:hypothetical protein
VIKTSLDTSEGVTVLGKLASARVDGGRRIQFALRARCV